MDTLIPLLDNDVREVRETSVKAIKDIVTASMPIPCLDLRHVLINGGTRQHEREIANSGCHHPALKIAHSQMSELSEAYIGSVCGNDEIWYGTFLVHNKVNLMVQWLGHRHWENEID